MSSEDVQVDLSFAFCISHKAHFSPFYDVTQL